MQIGVSSGHEHLVPEQERDVVRINLFIAWVGDHSHERGASAMEKIDGEGLTWENHLTGEGTRVKPPCEKNNCDLLLWSVQKRNGSRRSSEREKY